MSNYSVLHGVEHLHKLDHLLLLFALTQRPCNSNLNPENFGYYSSDPLLEKLIVLIDLFHTDEDGFSEIDQVLPGAGEVLARA